MIVARSLEEFATLLGTDAAVEITSSGERTPYRRDYEYWTAHYNELWKSAVLADERYRNIEQALRLYSAAAHDVTRARDYLAKLPVDVRSLAERRTYWRLERDGVLYRLDPAGKTWQPCAPDPPRERLPSHREPALEAAIVEEPLDVARWAVYADWLQERGDPRGELASLQIAAAIQNRPEQHARIDELMKRYEERFIGRTIRYALEHELRRDPGTLGWSNGFIASIAAWRRPAAALVEAVVEHPSGFALSRFAIDSQANLQPEIDVLHRIPALRELHLQSSAPAAGDFSDAWPAVARAIDVELDGSFLLGAIVLPAATRVAIERTLLDLPTVNSLASAQWPALQRLELVVHDQVDEARKPFTKWLASLDAPALVELYVYWHGRMDAAAEAIARSPGRGRLRSLKLGGGNLTPHGVRALAAAELALHELVIEDDAELSPTTKKALEPLLEAARRRRRESRPG